MLGDNLYIHNKTGNLYALVQTDIIECTNGREDKKYVVYLSIGNAKTKVFCREQEEFFRKFTKYECHK